MRHQIKGRKLGKNSAHRKAMMRNMVTSLLDHEKIETTEIKAKELRRHAEKIITLGKKGTLHARRLALEVVRDREVVKKVFDELAQRYSERQGGYTRIIKLVPRKGDNSPMSIIELVTEPVKGKKKGKPTRRRRAKAKSKTTDAAVSTEKKTEPKAEEETVKAEEAEVKEPEAEKTESVDETAAKEEAKVETAAEETPEPEEAEEKSKEKEEDKAE